MEFSYLLRNDYDEKQKLNKQDLFCYSKKQLDDIYPNRGYYIIGSITGKDFSKEKGSINKFIYNGNAYALYESGKKSKLIYRNIGYICVGDDKYIEVLKNRVPFLIIFLLLLCGIIAVSGVLINNYLSVPDESQEPQVVALNPLPEIDPNGKLIEEETTKAQEPQNNNGGGKVSMAYTLEAKLSLSAGKIDMMFQNPSVSNHSVIIELYVASKNQDVLVGESKLIKPGYGVETLDFIRDSAILKEGVYDGYYKVKYYDNNTGEKAIVESQIAQVKIIVNN